MMVPKYVNVRRLGRYFDNFDKIFAICSEDGIITAFLSTHLNVLVC